MAIIKPGFSKGFRGRSSAASFGRRANYLAAEHDRAGVLILDRESEGLTAKGAIETMGGGDAEYHEVIASPSSIECMAIQKYGSSGDDQAAVSETARRISEEYAAGRDYVTAIHWSEDGRFHFHVTVKGAEGPNTFGERGQFQKAWNSKWIIQPTDNRIKDWGLHGQAKSMQAKATEISKEQRQAARDRQDQLKNAPPELKKEILSRCRDRETDLASQRLELEVQGIQIRYESRGISDSILKEVEIEKAQIRYQRSMNDLDRAEERHLSNQLMNSHNSESKALAKEFGKEFRLASEESRPAIRSEHKIAQAVLVDRIISIEREKIDVRHREGGTIGSIAHKADLHRMEEVRTYREEQAAARFIQEETRARLTEARKERDSSFKKADGEAQKVEIQSAYESKRLDLWEATTAARVRVVDLDYRIRGTENGEAHLRAIARVSEQEGKSIDKSIETDKIRDEIVNLKVELNDLSLERRDAYRISDPEEREATLERINDEEIVVSQKVMAYELAMLRREYDGKADRAQWQKSRDELIEKSRKEFHASTKIEEEIQHKEEDEAGIKHHSDDEKKIQEHEAEEERVTQLHYEHERDGAVEEERGRTEFVAILEIGVASNSVDQEGDAEPQVTEENDSSNNLQGAPESWPEDLRSEYQARMETIQARFQAVQDRQILDPLLQEKRDALSTRMDQAREELKTAGSDKSAVIASFRQDAGSIRTEIQELQKERMDTYFRPRNEGGIGSEEYQKAVIALESKSSLHSLREDLALERTATFAQRSEDLKALDQKAERDCLPKEEIASLKEAIYLRVEGQEQILALRLREEEHRHHESTEEGQALQQQEGLADERLAASLERITLDREIRGVREDLREIRTERSEALTGEGINRSEVAESYEAKLQPSRIEMERLEAARLDTYHKGQPEGRAIGSEAHKEAQESLKIQQKAALEREGLQLQHEINRLDRNEHTQGLGSPEDRSRREELHREHDEREVSIAAKLQEMDRRGIEHSLEEGEEKQQAFKDLEARYAAIPERQGLDRQIRADQDALRDQRQATLERIETPGVDRAQAMEEHRTQAEGIRADLNRHQAERLDCLRQGQPEERAIGSDDHRQAREDLSARQELQAVRDSVSMDRQVLSMDRREALEKVEKENRHELLSQPEIRDRREDVHRGFSQDEIALANRTLQAERSFVERTTEEGSKQREQANREAEERHAAAVERQGIEAAIRQVRDQIQDTRSDRSETLAREGINRSEVAESYEAKLQPSRTELERLEAARLDTYHKGQPEGRDIGSEVHAQALTELEARQTMNREREALSLEKETIKYDRKDAVAQVEDRDVREAVHGRFDGQEINVALRESDLERRQAALNHPENSEAYKEAMSHADARPQMVQERQALDQQIRFAEDKIQSQKEAIRDSMEVPGAKRQQILEDSRQPLQSAREDLERLQVQRLDSQFEARGQTNSLEHLEARQALGERQAHRGAMDGLGLERSAMSADRREAMATLQSARMQSDGKRAVMQRIPKVGGVLGLATKPSERVQISKRESIHKEHDQREQALAAKTLVVERAHIDRTLPQGSKEHERAIQLAETRAKSVPERQNLDRELRAVRDKISEVRTEAANAERRPFTDKEQVRTCAATEVNTLRDQAEALELRRLSVQYAAKEPIKMDSPEGRAHLQEAAAAREHLVKDQGLRREIDDIRQNIGHSRTDYQEQYKRNILERGSIQREYKDQELQKVDRIHVVEVQRIDARHLHNGTTGSSEHKADLQAESSRHAEGRLHTEERDLGRKMSAMEVYAHAKTIANFAVNGAAPDRIAKQVESRAMNAVTNAALDATLGQYAAVAKVAKQVLTLGR